MPSGSAGVGAGDVEPGLKWLWSYDIGERMAIAGNVNLAIPSAEGDRFLQTAASLSVGVEVTEGVGAYAEYFGFYPVADTEDASHTLNGGMTFGLGPDAQVDVRAGFGLNEQADDFFAGAGISWRW